MGFRLFYVDPFKVVQAQKGMVQLTMRVRLQRSTWRKREFGMFSPRFVQIKSQDNKITKIQDYKICPTYKPGKHPVVGGPRHGSDGVEALVCKRKRGEERDEHCC